MPRLESIHLASTHKPFDTRIFYKECKTLAAAGYRVTLIVPHDRDEVVDGVRIRAVPRPANGRERLFVTLGQLYRAALEENRDAVFHFHDAELIFHMFRLKARGRTVIYDAHENTPEQVMYQHWIPAPLRGPVSVVMRWAEWLGGRWFDGVISAVPEILDRFPGGHRALVCNFPVADELRPAHPVPYAHRPPRIAYVGGITEVRGVREMVTAMDRLPTALGAELVLAGSFHPATLEQEIQQLPGADRIRFLGFLSRARLAEVLSQSRIGIVTLHPTRQYVKSFPTKLFEYMSVGLPVIASDFPLWRRIIEEAGCGLLVDARNPDAIAEAVQWFLEHPDEAEAMGRRGQQAVYARYNWEQETQKLLAFYASLENQIT